MAVSRAAPRRKNLTVTDGTVSRLGTLMGIMNSKVSHSSFVTDVVTKLCVANCIQPRSHQNIVVYMVTSKSDI